MNTNRYLSISSIQYRSLRFGKRSIEQLLTRNTDQIITGNITINGNVLVTNNTGISIRHLSTNNDVFGVSLDFMLADCVERIASQPPHLVATKLISHMYIGHLVVETNFWQSNRSTAAIKTLYESLRYGITMDGDNIVLNNQFAIGQMTATETINGMASSSFGLDWLLIETDQVCSRPTTTSLRKFIVNLDVHSISDVHGGAIVHGCHHRR